jgi:hypothetical protein
MKTINNLLTELKACDDAVKWAKDKSWEEIYTTCHKGDWLLWLFNKTNPDDLQLLTLAKGHVANTVRHLMKNERSIKAVDAAIAFGEGKITRAELNAAASASYAAAYAASAAAYAAAYADASAAAYADASAAYADASAAAYAAYASKKAKEENQMLTANICRQYLPVEIWNITFD